MGKALASVGILPPFPTSRKRPEHERAAIRKHAAQVGNIVHAWNSAHGALYWIFWTLLGKGTDTGFALWNSIQSDKTQREMLERLALSATGQTKTIIKSIVWTTKAMHELSKYRNDAAHVQMIYYYDKLVPSDLTSRPQSLERISQSPVESYWRRLCGDLRAIESYAMDLHLALMTKSPRPLSKRPRLQLAQVKFGRSPLKPRPRKRTVRKPRS